MNRVDYTGQRFGHLTVLEMLYGYGKHGEAYCRCECECGNEVIKASYSIRHSRYPANCGCMKEIYKRDQSRKLRIDLTGKRFGRLIITEMIYKDGEHTKVKCKCDCGNEIIRIATYLTSGETQSCGCYHRERTAESNCKDYKGVVSDYGVELLCKDYQTDRGVWMWKCKCYCGNIFTALPAKILNGHTTSCGCMKRSGHERLISTILEQNKIDFIPEYKFEECKDKRPLPFDFYIPTYNTVIEYQGAQHYYPRDYFGGEESFKEQIKRDNIKRKFCKDKNISLIEIPYTLSDEEIKQLIQTLFIRRDCNGLYSNI